jgi:hypothetical protein
VADRVRPIGIEIAALGGGQDVIRYRPIDKNEDGLEMRALFLQNDSSGDDAVGATRNGTNDLLFFDPVAGTVSLSTLKAKLSSVPIASASTVGGIRVGNGLSIDANGILSATGGGDGDGIGNFGQMFPSESAPGDDETPGWNFAMVGGISGFSPGFRVMAMGGTDTGTSQIMFIPLIGYGDTNDFSPSDEPYIYIDHFDGYSWTGPTKIAAGYANEADFALAADAANVAGRVSSYLTFNNSGSGVASGSTYNGSAARTVSYNTIGAAAAAHSHSLLAFNDSGEGDNPGTTYSGSASQTISYNTVGAAAAVHGEEHAPGGSDPIPFSSAYIAEKTWFSSGPIYTDTDLWEWWLNEYYNGISGSAGWHVRAHYTDSEIYTYDFRVIAMYDDAYGGNVRLTGVSDGPDPVLIGYAYADPSNDVDLFNDGIIQVRLMRDLTLEINPLQGPTLFVSIITIPFIPQI